MGDKPMPAQGSQQLRIAINVLTKFGGNAAGSWHTGDSCSLGRRARSRGRRGGRSFRGCGSGPDYGGGLGYLSARRGGRQSSVKGICR